MATSVPPAKKITPKREQNPRPSTLSPSISHKTQNPASTRRNPKSPLPNSPSPSSSSSSKPGTTSSGISSNTYHARSQQTRRAPTHINVSTSIPKESKVLSSKSRSFSLPKSTLSPKTKIVGTNNKGSNIKKNDKKNPNTIPRVKSAPLLTEEETQITIKQEEIEQIEIGEIGEIESVTNEQGEQPNSNEITENSPVNGELEAREEVVTEPAQPLTSNEVIEEAKNKLLGERKGKVKALVGAFETVLSFKER